MVNCGSFLKVYLFLSIFPPFKTVLNVSSSTRWDLEIEICLLKKTKTTVPGVIVIKVTSFHFFYLVT